MNQKSLVFVVFGTGSDGKPHAARFEAVDESVVRKAAGLMGFKIGRAESDEARAVAKKLPDGKLFQAGRAFVPYVKQDLFDHIRGLLIIDQVATSTGATPAAAMAPPEKNGTKVVAAAPCDAWAQIKVGSVVLCWEKGGADEDPAWYEAVVVAIAKDGETMTMRWRDHPQLKKFTVKRHAVGLLAQTTKSALG